MAELYSYFFPAEKAYFQKRAKDGAESRFQGGIHFRSDNEVGLDMGRKVGAAIIKKISSDGVDERLAVAKRKYKIENVIFSSLHEKNARHKALVSKPHGQRRQIHR